MVRNYLDNGETSSAHMGSTTISFPRNFFLFLSDTFVQRISDPSGNIQKSLY